MPLAVGEDLLHKSVKKLQGQLMQLEDAPVRMAEAGAPDAALDAKVKSWVDVASSASDVLGYLAPELEEIAVQAKVLQKNLSLISYELLVQKGLAGCVDDAFLETVPQVDALNIITKFINEHSQRASRAQMLQSRFSKSPLSTSHWSSQLGWGRLAKARQRPS